MYSAMRMSTPGFAAVYVNAPRIGRISSATPKMVAADKTAIAGIANEIVLTADNQ